MAFTRIFSEVGDFAACRAAETFLKHAGFSVGRMQAGEPRGVLFGDYDIQKWRNLRPSERQELHGRLTGNMRQGPVVVVLDRLPDDAARSLESAQRGEVR